MPVAINVDFKALARTMLALAIAEVTDPQEPVKITPMVMGGNAAGRKTPGTTPNLRTLALSQ